MHQLELRDEAQHRSATRRTQIRAEGRTHRNLSRHCRWTTSLCLSFRHLRPKPSRRFIRRPELRRGRTITTITTITTISRVVRTIFRPQRRVPTLPRAREKRTVSGLRLPRRANR